MTSAIRVLSNRLNAKKSTGPITFRGKSLSRFNAVKHGLFALQRLIPGEDKIRYEKLSSRIVGEMSPKTAVENMLVDQIIGAMWRLRRLELTEIEYFARRRKNLVADAMVNMSTEEYEIATQLIDDDEQLQTIKADRDRKHEFESLLKDPKSTESDDEPDSNRNDEAAREKLESANALAVIYLDGMSDAADSFPFFLERLRGSMVRDIVRNHASLVRMQKQRNIKNGS